MKEVILDTVIVIVLLATLITLLVMLCRPIPADVEVETYTEGYEITHMEIDRGKAYVSARNDNNSFTIKTSGQIFAKYVVGDVCEVEVKVMRQGKTYYNEYAILGLDK